MQKRSRYIIAAFSVSLIIMSGCGEFARVQKNGDNATKYSYAKKYYNQGKFRKAADLLVDVVPSYDGTSEGAQAIFLLADSHLQLKEGAIASEYFHRYLNSYPNSIQAEEAKYKEGLSLYIVSPDPRLDQTETYEAIKSLQSFLETYPDSKYRTDAQQKLFELQDKLADKELQTAQLYYNLGMYMGNNYESSIITIDNALRDYPYTKHREDLVMLELKAKYQMAKNSVIDKRQIRYRDVIDQYYEYINQYPAGKYIEQAKNIFNNSNKQISK